MFNTSYIFFPLLDTKKRIVLLDSVLYALQITNQ